MSHAFEAKGVVKHFGDVRALNGVSLKADAGKILGLLGPNGAGKTTLVRMLSTLLEPDEGTLKVEGVNVVEHPEQVRKLIGLAGQFAAVDEYLTGYENVYMIGRLYHLSHREAKERALDLLERLNLSKSARRPVRTYSGGMRRRLDLGASLIGQPKVLFLDEPTTGLDPKTRLDLWEIIRDLVQNGTSILLTTQYLEEADQLADNIAVLNEGKIIAEGTSSQLKARLGGDIIEFELANQVDRPAAMQAVAKFAPEGGATLDEATQHIRVAVGTGGKVLMPLVQSLNDAKINVVNLSLHRPSLDDVFLTLTGAKAKPKTAPTKKKGRRS